MRQKVYKNIIEFILLGRLLLGLPLSVFYIPSETSLERANCQLETASWLEMGMCFYFHLSALGSYLA